MANCVGGGTGETEPPFGGLEAVTGATAGKKRIEMSIFWSLFSFILITLLLVSLMKLNHSMSLYYVYFLVLHEFVVGVKDYGQLHHSNGIKLISNIFFLLVRRF